MITRKEKLAHAKAVRSLTVQEIISDSEWWVSCAGTCKDAACKGWHIVGLHHKRFTCSCPAGQYGRFCKHVERVVRWWYEECQGLRATLCASEAEAERQRRKYRPVLMLSGAVKYAVIRRSKSLIPFD